MAKRFKRFVITVYRSGSVLRFRKGAYRASPRRGASTGCRPANDLCSGSSLRSARARQSCGPKAGRSCGLPRYPQHIGTQLAKERHMRAFARRSCDPPIPLGIGKTTSKCQHIMQFRYQGEAAGCRDARDALLGLKPAGHACLPKLRASATGGCGSPIPLGIGKTTSKCQHIMQFRYQGEAAGCRAARNSISACRSLRDRTFGTFGCSPPHPSAAPTAPISCPPRT